MDATYITEAEIEAVEVVLQDAEPMLDQDYNAYYRTLAKNIVEVAAKERETGSVLDASDDLLAAADRFDAALGEGRR